MCNQNEGFLFFVLHIVTIVISIIAITTSFKVVKLPYRIKLKVMPVAYKSLDGVMVDLVIYNQGKIETGIDHISIADNKKEENMIDLNNKIVITIHDSYGNEYVFKNGFPVG